jgi:colicin import membrane protein
MSRITPPPAPVTRPADQPEFPYGWREVQRALPDGSVEFDRVPLTLEDVLHPREGDVIPQRSLHEIECGYLAAVLRSRDLRPPIARVTADLLIDWGVPGMRNHSPDVAVFVEMRREPDLNEGTFHLKDSGGRCLLAIEIVSPDTRVNDAVHKVDHYYRAGVPHYVLVDQERENRPRRLVSYRLGKTSYEAQSLAADGRLPLPEVGLLLGLRDGRLICWDLDTGKELGDPASAYRELEKADRTILEQAQAIEESELARRTAEEQTRQAREQARLEAEQARQAREQAQLEAEQARQAREQVRLEAERNRDALARIRELEEQIRKLQATSPDKSQ